jgi:DNA-binding protein YbaB
MNEPRIQLNPEEFDKLTLEERMAYMQTLMSDLQQRLAQTRQQAEHTSNIVFLRDWRNRRR